MPFFLLISNFSTFSRKMGFKTKIMTLLLVTITSIVIAKPAADRAYGDLHEHEFWRHDDYNAEESLPDINENGVESEIVKKAKKMVASMYDNAIRKRSFGHGRVHQWLAGMQTNKGSNVGTWHQQFRNMFGR